MRLQSKKCKCEFVLNPRLAIIPVGLRLHQPKGATADYNGLKHLCLHCQCACVHFYSASRAAAAFESATYQWAAWIFHTPFQTVIPLNHSSSQSYGEKFAWVDWPNLICHVKKKKRKKNASKVCQRKTKNTHREGFLQWLSECVWVPQSSQ